MRSNNTCSYYRSLMYDTSRFSGVVHKKVAAQDRDASNRKADPLVLGGDDGADWLSDVLIVLPRRARAHPPKGLSLYARLLFSWGELSRTP
jgi:hypothetical protein